MRLLVFQHVDCEHPGSFRQYLEEDGVSWDAIELDEGEQIPNLESYDALWVMGGAMDVWDVAEHPWLIEEKKVIRHWVQELKKPFLGFCLGHQLLADALGGTCGPSQQPEIGIMDVALTDYGKADPVFGNLPAVQKCLQWHSVEVAQAPDGAEILATSPNCPIQAMRYGKNAWSAQFHLEIEPDTVDNWAKVPEYHHALEQALGQGAIEKMNRAAKASMEEFSKNSKLFYDGFMAQIRN